MGSEADGPTPCDGVGATATLQSVTSLTASTLNSRLNFRLVISTLQFLGHDLIFVSTKPAAGQFGGMTVSEAKRLKALEDENAKLKKLLAEQMLDLAAMKELVSKKW